MVNLGLTTLRREEKCSMTVRSKHPPDGMTAKWGGLRHLAQQIAKYEPTDADVQVKYSSRHFAALLQRYPLCK